MKAKSGIRLGLCCVAMSCLAGAVLAAAHTVKFEDVPLSNSYPNGSNFVSFGVLINVIPVNLVVGNSCTPTNVGAATIVTKSFAPCPLGSANHQVIIDEQVLDFSIPNYSTIIGSPVRKVKAKYVIQSGPVELTVNGQCIVRPNFAAMVGTYGSFKVVDNGCAVVVKALPGATIVQYGIGGDVLFIDDVKASG